MPAHPPVAKPADLGLNPLTFRLLALQIGLYILSAVLYPIVGLSIDIAEGKWIPRAVQAAVALTVWGYYFWQPGRRSEWISAEASMAFLLMLTFAAVATPGQYLAAAFNRPLIDSTLAWWDSLLGIDVPSLVTWTRQYPNLSAVLIGSYFTLLPQFVLIVPVLWLWSDRRALWEYTFHFHVCTTTTVLVSAIFPVASVFQYFGFESLLDQSRFIAHFQGVRDGSRMVVPLGNMEGLVSMPSLHAAGAMLVTWAVRRIRPLVWPVSLLNTLLIASTVLTGAHYVVDVLAAGVMVAVSVLAYRRLEPRWFPLPSGPSSRQHASPKVGAATSASGS